MARTTPTTLALHALSRTGVLLALLLATARADAADSAGCADIGERIEARFRNARQGCLVRALRREARGLAADAAACEAKRLARTRQLLVKSGADDGSEDRRPRRPSRDERWQASVVAAPSPRCATTASATRDHRGRHRARQPSTKSRA